MKTIGDTLPRRFKAKASGAITAGKPVIVEADGDVAQVALSSISSPSSGTAVEFIGELLGPNPGVYPIVIYDSSNEKIVVYFQDDANSDYHTAMVGTVNASDNSISFGTKVVVASAASNMSFGCFDATNNKVILGYNGQTAHVGTVSGDSISFGSAQTLTSDLAQHSNLVYDPDSGKVVLFYQDYFNSYYGTAIVCTVSGNSISAGSETVFHSGTVMHVKACYDTGNDKFIVFFLSTLAGYGDTALYGVVGSVSGTSISFGSVSSRISTQAGVADVNCDFDSGSGKGIVVYSDGAQSDSGYAAVATVSGTSLSVGTPAQFDSGNTNDIDVSYDPDANKSIIVYRDGNNSSYGTSIQGTVSGTSISFANALVYATTDADAQACAYETSQDRTVIVYRDDTNSDKGMAVVYSVTSTTTNLTSENYIGIAEYAAADTATATVLIKGGVSTTQSSLTPGQTYFVQGDGTIGTSADSPSVTAGTAVTSTKLIVKG